MIKTILTWSAGILPALSAKTRKSYFNQTSSLAELFYAACATFAGRMPALRLKPHFIFYRTILETNNQQIVILE